MGGLTPEARDDQIEEPMDYTPIGVQLSRERDFLAARLAVSERREQQLLHALRLVVESAMPSYKPGRPMISGTAMDAARAALSSFDQQEEL